MNLWNLEIVFQQRRYELLLLCDPESLPLLLQRIEPASLQLKSIDFSELSLGPGILFWIPGRSFPFMAELKKSPLKWLIWDPGGDASQASASQGFVVKPRTFSDFDLGSLLEALNRLRADRPAFSNKIVRLERNEQVIVQEYQVLTVKQGLVRCMHLLENGEALLQGIYGKQDVLLGHDPNHCQVTMVAHTDATVQIQGWHELRDHSGF